MLGAHKQISLEGLSGNALKICKKLMMLGNIVIGINDWAIAFTTQNEGTIKVFNYKYGVIINKAFTDIEMCKHFVMGELEDNSIRNSTYAYRTLLFTADTKDKDLLSRYKRLARVEFYHYEDEVILVKRNIEHKVTLVSRIGKVKTFEIPELCGLNRISMASHNSGEATISLVSNMIYMTGYGKELADEASNRMFDVDLNLNIIRRYK